MGGIERFLLRMERPMNTRLPAACVFLLLVAAADWTYAADYDLSWFTIDGGGVMSSSDGQPGGFELSGTIGQHDAGPATAMTGGDFNLVGGLWAGATGFGQPCSPEWEDLFSVDELNDSSHALVGFSDATGPSLYVGGFFTTAGGVPASCIAKWDGSAWAPLGTGMNTDDPEAYPVVTELTVHNDGNGAALYAGGNFQTAGGAAALNIAKWNGLAWSSLSTGMNDFVYALTEFNDGTDLSLYAGGSFISAGGQLVNRVAKWDGTAWSPLGSGANNSVYGLATYDDGTGLALYAAGDFTEVGGVGANRVAKWDGIAWSPLGMGVNSSALALATFDDGTGMALYVAGSFTTAGGMGANRVAKWDGSTWSALGAGVNNTASSLVAHDDGAGLALYVAGIFTTAGGSAANRIAKWNGSAWSPLGTGMNASVAEVTVVDIGQGNALYAAGGFTTAGGHASGHIARWSCPPPTVPSDFDSDGDVDLDDFSVLVGCLQGPTIPPASGCAPTDLDLDNDVDLVDFAQFQIAFGN